jgi:AraC-like DNA-binding protein
MYGSAQSVQVSFMANAADHPALSPLPGIELREFGALPLGRWQYPNSIYPCWRLYWNDAPGALVTASEAFAVDPSHLVLIPPYTPVSLSLARPIPCHLYFCFNVSSPAMQAERRVWRIAIEPPIRKLAGAVAAALLTNTPGRLTSMQVLTLIAHGLSTVPEDRWQNQAIDPRIGEAMAFIERSLAHPVASRILAARVHLTANSFARLFRRELGASPRQYIMQRRLARASHLLLTTTVPIKQIAAECGFCDRYYFTRMFRAAHGIGPGAYRRRRT